MLTKEGKSILINLLYKIFRAEIMANSMTSYQYQAAQQREIAICDLLEITSDNLFRGYRLPEYIKSLAKKKQYKKLPPVKDYQTWQRYMNKKSKSRAIKAYAECLKAMQAEWCDGDMIDLGSIMIDDFKKPNFNFNYVERCKGYYTGLVALSINIKELANVHNRILHQAYTKHFNKYGQISYLPVDKDHPEIYNNQWS